MDLFKAYATLLLTIYVINKCVKTCFYAYAVMNEEDEENEESDDDDDKNKLPESIKHMYS